MKATKKLSKRTEGFLNYNYKGDGKYYLNEQGSRHYNMSLFNHFKSNNTECINIIEHGNDAPKGGSLGSYVIVVFTWKFTEKYGWFFEQKKAQELRLAEAQDKKDALITVLTVQFKEFVDKNPEKVEEWKEKIKNISSKKARMFKENRVARVTGNQEFWGKYRIFDEVIFNR